MPDRDRGPHCPFLNRSDGRCSEFFSLDHLQHAFEFCFDAYKACPVYAELLGERQERRQAAAHGYAAAGDCHRGGGGRDPFNGWATAALPGRTTTTTPTHANPRLVQVTVSPRLARLGRGVAGRLAAHHHAQHDAAGQGLPALPGF